MYEITVFGNQVTLNGVSIPVAPGENPHVVAVEAAKAQAAREFEPGTVVHVMAHTEQGAFPLAIVDGEAMAVGEVDPDAEPPATPQPAREREPVRDDSVTHQALDETQTAESESVTGPGVVPREVQTGQMTAPVSTGEISLPQDDVEQSPLARPGVHQDAAPVDGTGQPPAIDPPAPARQEAPHWYEPQPIPPVEREEVPRPEPSPAGVVGAIRAMGVVTPEEAAQPDEPENPFAHTFIEKHRVESGTTTKAPTGLAGVLAQFGIGGPSAAQRTEDEDRLAVAKVWTRPKGIAVANGKGGSGKTPTALYIAAMFARFGGGMVLVDDNNTFRGAAGWQTENAAHGATKEDLLQALPHFNGSERAADMARFTHHQTIDRYDVLQSRPQKLARDQAIDDAEFDTIQELLRRFYRVVIFDSGNDESAPNWLRMIHHSDMLVVPTATTPKHCESAKLLLEALTAQGGHSAELARNAVIVVTHASTNDPAPEQIAPRFAGMARSVLTIPHDPAIAREWLRWDDLAPKTQRAWLAVGAAIARGMED